MLGTIEDLNKDIEKFQRNVAVSNELYDLLDQLIKGVNQQNKQLGQRAETVLQQLEELPGEIKDSNTQSEMEIQRGVQHISDATLASQKEQHQKYLDAISQLYSQIQQYVSTMEKITQTLKELPEVIKSMQSQLNKDQQDAFSRILESFEQGVKKEQQDYLTGLKNAREAIVNYQDEIKKLPDVISSEQRHLNASHQDEMHKLLTEAQSNITSEQNKYIAELQKTREAMNNYQKELEDTYKDFLQTLKNTNIVQIHDQNVQLQKTLDQRTMILTIISLAAIVASIIGWFI